MFDLILLAGIGFAGVSLGYGIGGMLAANAYENDPRLLADEEGILCYECRSLVGTRYVEDDEKGFPKCPVCSGNMLPPVGGVTGGDT